MTELWEKSFIERQTMWGFEPAESAIFANAFFVEKRVNNPSRQKRKMKTSRAIHPDFQSLLTLKEPEVIDLFCDLRDCILELYPESNELLYHTHALTAVFSISEKLSDAFCMLPIYTNHLNLGFNKGTLLKDPNKLFSGTGNLIRHIDVKTASDYRNPKVKALIKEAIDFAIKDMDKPTKSVGMTISKIKKKESFTKPRIC